ncbi:hypothetical protein NP493_1143g01029 [Ridgeia piscesae]|uniref:Reverse transcriptase domain-containing protein n=1 Tax=Ridgeia piscesae TaxID=27915 RepID=A0AAD9KFQ4_RIDPI|nr:hypothetical protein NP493_1143g01029 [Ridgeia piscesae]
MYADDLCIFSPRVAGLRKLTDCCANYGELFNITYNAKKSFCMVIDNKPQDMKSSHCIHLSNHPLPYTTKCKYLGHIINNNLTDDDDIARQKRCLYAQANVLARKCCLCNISTNITLFQAYCAPMYNSSLWCKLKNYSLKSITVAYNNSLTILLNLPSWYKTIFCVNKGAAPPPNKQKIKCHSYKHFDENDFSEAVGVIPFDDA